MKRDFNAWLASLGPAAPVKSLTELREWNKAHEKVGAIKYGQTLLDLLGRARSREGQGEVRGGSRARHPRSCGTNGIDAAVKANNLDALLFPGPAAPGIASKPGYPTVLVPFGMIPNTPGNPGGRGGGRRGRGAAPRPLRHRRRQRPATHRRQRPRRPRRQLRQRRLRSAPRPRAATTTPPPPPAPLPPGFDPKPQPYGVGFTGPRAASRSSCSSRTRSSRRRRSARRRRDYAEFAERDGVCRSELRSRPWPRLSQAKPEPVSCRARRRAD